MDCMADLTASLRSLVLGRQCLKYRRSVLGRRLVRRSAWQSRRECTPNPEAVTFNANKETRVMGDYNNSFGLSVLGCLLLSAGHTPVYAADVVGTLIRTIDTSRFSPPSPDPSGLEFVNATGRLIISDGEVEEMSIYAGANMYETTLSGTLLRTWKTSFSDEPTGVAYNQANNHLFISDDVKRDIFEINPGPDQLHGTADDIVASFDTAVFGSGDPEGVAFSPVDGALYIADGVNREVYRVAPGPNGKFDGVAPAGDDQVTHFDTSSLGLDD